MDMYDWMVDGHVKTFLTLDLETWAIASGNQRETQVTDGGCEEVKDEAGVYDEETKQSAKMEGDGQTSQVDFEGCCPRCNHDI